MPPERLQERLCFLVLWDFGILGEIIPELEHIQPLAMNRIIFSNGLLHGFPSCSCSARKMREQRGTKSCCSFGLVFSGAPSRASVFSFKKLSPLSSSYKKSSLAGSPPRARSVSAMRRQQRKEGRKALESL